MLSGATKKALKLVGEAGIVQILPSLDNLLLRLGFDKAFSQTYSGI
jgi:hypothetical protein